MNGVLVALLSALAWAVASVLFGLSARRLHVVPLNLVRTAVSTVFFWALLPFYGGLEKLAALAPSEWLWLVVSVVGLLVVGDTLYFRSLDLIGVSWAMPVASINTLWAVLLAAGFLHEPLTWRLAGGAVLVVCGVILVSRSTIRDANGGTGAASARRTGLMLAVATSLLWGAGQVALKPATAGINAVVANCVRQPMGMGMLLGMTLAMRRAADVRPATQTRRAWALILLASLLGTGVGSLLFVMAIQMAGAGRAAVLTTTAPVMAIPFSVWWLRERPNRLTLAGTLLTTAGIVLVA